ncbi:MAG: hypothetical protein QOH05_4174 [Acetobacteraceae bacterium]|nr:hypothetical protein [Acetobacteraceae bacterium]
MSGLPPVCDGTWLGGAMVRDRTMIRAMHSPYCVITGLGPVTYEFRVDIQVVGGRATPG